MASTPEGKVKMKITKLLDSYDGSLYYWMPVPSGFGTRQVDYVGVHKGQFFCIEAKKPGGKPTPLQYEFMKCVDRAGGAWFVVDDDVSLAQVKGWLDRK